jgi:Carbohydrate-selective porin, OprB family
MADTVAAHHSESPESPPAAPQLLAEPNVSQSLDPDYDQYLDWKEQLENESNLDYSLDASVLPQWSVPKSGSAGIDFIWTPTVVWKPFADTWFGSGTFAFSAQQNQFWNGPNTSTFQIRAGLLSALSDWFVNSTDYALLTYTHTLPGDWRWLSLTIGQYGFGAYDGNQYAGNAQTNFVNYALAQNGTQTYASAGLGAYAQASAPKHNLLFAGGVQGATDLSGSTITTRGLASGKEAYFLAAQWTPNLLGGGSYGALWYQQPALPAQELSAARGFSFSAVQNIDTRWGVFLRANTATGSDSYISTSVAWGAVRNDPFVRTPLDQIGLGIAWNKTNVVAVGAAARSAEWAVEIYYAHAIFKGLRVTPDIQFYPDPDPDPALTPAAGPAAVFTLRTTTTF